jgi:hypothetical protein
MGDLAFLAEEETADNTIKFKNFFEDLFHQGEGLAISVSLLFSDKLTWENIRGNSCKCIIKPFFRTLCVYGQYRRRS